METQQLLKSIVRDVAALDGKAVVYKKQCKYLIQRCGALRSVLQVADETANLYVISAPALGNLTAIVGKCRDCCIKFNTVLWFEIDNLAYNAELEFLNLHQALDEAIKDFVRHVSSDVSTS
jgi:hypothetical protein